MKRLRLENSERREVTEDARVEVADGAEATLVIMPRGDMSVEVFTGRGCRLSSYILQERGSKVRQTNHVGEGSVVSTCSLWLEDGGGTVLNSLEGRGAEAYDLHIFVERGERKLHLDSILRHAERDTKGDILVKGIVRDNAAARLDGMIKIEKNGAGADSFLSEHVMLLNPGAHASANPELEIENNDVTSRHAASVSQIDEEKIFYLVSRGLGREEARRLIIEGFMESAIDRVGDPKMRKRFAELAGGAL
jgi:Fe-S cluster assembly scaffold protein SufB